MADKTFIRITNRDIYKILKEHTGLFKEMIIKQTETNGKVKLNRWIATTAFSLVTSLIVIGIGFTIKGGI